MRDPERSAATSVRRENGYGPALHGFSSSCHYQSAPICGSDKA